MTADETLETQKTTAPVVQTPRLAIVLGNIGRALILAGIVTFLFV